MAEYTMALTRRHVFPDEARGTIYPSNAAKLEGENKVHRAMRLDAWAEFTIPADCTQLRVYMSGYPRLLASLIRVCKKRGINADLLAPRNKTVKRQMDEDTTDTVSKDTKSYKVKRRIKV